MFWTTLDHEIFFALQVLQIVFPDLVKDEAVELGRRSGNPELAAALFRELGKELSLTVRPFRFIGREIRGYNGSPEFQAAILVSAGKGEEWQTIYDGSWSDRFTPEQHGKAIGQLRALRDYAMPRYREVCAAKFAAERAIAEEERRKRETQKARLDAAIAEADLVAAVARLGGF